MFPLGLAGDHQRSNATLALQLSRMWLEQQGYQGKEHSPWHGAGVRGGGRFVRSSELRRSLLVLYGVSSFPLLPRLGHFSQGILGELQSVEA